LQAGMCPWRISHSGGFFLLWLRIKMESSIRNKAMDLLARREHSEQELRQKLKTREYDADAIDEVLQALKENRLQSDERFTESYVNHRFNAGVGPLKIRYELRQKGVSDGLVDEFLEPLSDQWDELMTRQRIRKYGASIPNDYAERMKQARFLQNRGFSPESVMRLFR
jgi:regulatory protein